MVNKEKIKEAVVLLLEGIGEDINREGLLDTPDRIARMYEEIFSGMDQDASQHLQKTFTAGHNEIVLEKDIVFVGVMGKVEIWSKERYQENNDFDDMDEIAEHMADLGITI